MPVSNHCNIMQHWRSMTLRRLAETLPGKLFYLSIASYDREAGVFQKNYDNSQRVKRFDLQRMRVGL